VGEDCNLDNTLDYNEESQTKKHVVYSGAHHPTKTNLGVLVGQLIASGSCALSWHPLTILGVPLVANRSLGKIRKIGTLPHRTS
jgi:hypothetical protein